MRTFFVVVGVVVVTLLFASSGVMRGDMCVGSIGCVGATSGGITIHGKTP